MIANMVNILVNGGDFDLKIDILCIQLNDHVLKFLSYFSPFYFCYP